MSRRKIRSPHSHTITTISNDGNLQLPPIASPFDIPKDTLCGNCKKRQATSVWTNGGTLDIIHGNYSYWCDLCITRESLLYARKQALRVPELVEELKKLEEKYGEPSETETDN